MGKIIALAMTALLLSGCSLAQKEEPVNLIQPSELQGKFEKDETFILVLENQQRCEPCVRYKEGGLSKLNKKEKYKAYAVEIDTVKQQKEMDILIKTLQKDLKVDTSQMVGTPSTYFIEKGELKSSTNGPLIYDQLKEDYDKFIKNK